jgi:predicted Zn finger-like uncharacterized protein
MTKFQLDDSRIPAKGAKVRCSRCRHVFHIVPPHETKEEVFQNFESFAKYHEELMGPGAREEEGPPDAGTEPRKETAAEIEESSLFSEEVPSEAVKETPFREPIDIKTIKPKRRAKEGRKTPSLLLIILLALAVLIAAFFYAGVDSEYGSRLIAFLDAPIQKVSGLWQGIRGSETEGLVVRDLNGYEEKIGEIPLYVIEGKVNNHSKSAKKQIKIRVSIFDQNKAKISQKEILCGSTIGRDDLKDLPASFFKGPLIVWPKTENEMAAAPGKAVPFIVLFKSLSMQAKEFQVEILEAPNL